jgi:septal ring factor EnvC (AmiA/AmiB activator)
MKKILLIAIVILFITSLKAEMPSRNPPDPKTYKKTQLKKTEYQRGQENQKAYDKNQRRLEESTLGSMYSLEDCRAEITKQHGRLNSLNLQLNLMQKQNQTLARQVLWLKKTIEKAGIKTNEEPNIPDIIEIIEPNNK